MAPAKRSTMETAMNLKHVSGYNLTAPKLNYFIHQSEKEEEEEEEEILYN
jgi:hypothetical protein